MNRLKRRMQKSGLTLILTALLVTLLFGVSTAQPDVATNTTTGTVVAVIVVTAVQPLAFGNIFQGVPVTVGWEAAGSGIFDITGAAGAGINLQLILPEFLTLANGSDRLPVLFGLTDAGVDANGLTPATLRAGPAPISFIDQNPYALPAGAAIGAGADGCSVYLGGRVNPSSNQAAGLYTADLILMVAYNNL